MTIIKRMDDLIKKLEANDQAFIEKLNNSFDEFKKTSNAKKGKHNV